MTEIAASGHVYFCKENHVPATNGLVTWEPLRRILETIIIWTVGSRAAYAFENTTYTTAELARHIASLSRGLLN